VKALGVDEHIWRPSRNASQDKADTVMVDLTRDEHGCLHARLLDAVQGRCGKAYADWLDEQGLKITGTVEHAALDPFRGYANAIRDQLPDATTVLDAFHVVKLAGNALDEVRRRVQQPDSEPARPQGRPALPDPTHPAHRPRAPHRQAAGPARQAPPGRRPRRGGRAVLGRSINRSARSTTPRPRDGRSQRR
jgi:transposase